MIPTPVPRSRTDLSARVLGLNNLFRLLVAPTLWAVRQFTRPDAPLGSGNPELFAILLVAWFAMAVVLAMARQQHWPSRLLMCFTHIVIDTLAIAGLLYVSGGITSNLALLLVVPVGSMALLAGGRASFFIAAIATLGVLGQQLLLMTDDVAGASANALAAAGVAGAVYFLLASSAWLVADRLTASEALARRQELDLANLAQLSQYVVQNLRESILVVDGGERIRLINDSAAQMLGIESPQPGTLLGEVAPTLLYRLTHWRMRRDGAGTEDGADEAPGMLTSADGARVLEPHFAALGHDEPPPVLIFLEDRSALAERVQQSKLASLGRLSASIAHEIRNPVGAMSHAAQLLAESGRHTAEDTRLTEIIRQHGQRVSDIIESVLRLSRRELPRPEEVDLGDWCRRFHQEYCATQQVHENRLQVMDGVSDVHARADAGQLQQIVWNLCDNALRHSPTGTPVEIRYGRLSRHGRPWLEVVDRGPGISAADAERIFEPFFTRGRGGTGLGLFLARELAEVNGATLLHEPRAGGGAVFRVVFSDPGRWVRSKAS